MSKPESETAPKLREIADRIAAHLKRMEMAQPNRGYGRSLYWKANSWPAGSKIGVVYISYQYEHKLTKADALEYLAWLDAGNEGTHHAVLGFNARTREPVANAE
jgi:hypothetical protein